MAFFLLSFDHIMTKICKLDVDNDETTHRALASAQCLLHLHSVWCFHRAECTSLSLFAFSFLNLGDYLWHIRCTSQDFLFLQHSPWRWKDATQKRSEMQKEIN